MKKTLLSVLAGLTVIGSASAAPTPEDRKALCDLLIKKGTHVWVEKTKACIPVDPCREAEDSDVFKAYCIYLDAGNRTPYEFFVETMPMDLQYLEKHPELKEVRKLWVERFAKQVLHLDPVNIDVNYGNSNDDQRKYPRFTTSDGGYYQIKVWAHQPDVVRFAPAAYVWAAITAYVVPEYGNYDYRYHQNEEDNSFEFPGNNETFCQDIKDFAELLAQDTFVENVKFSADDNKCILKFKYKDLPKAD